MGLSDGIMELERPGSNKGIQTGTLVRMAVKLVLFKGCILIFFIYCINLDLIITILVKEKLKITCTKMIFMECIFFNETFFSSI